MSEDIVNVGTPLTELVLLTFKKEASYKFEGEDVKMTPEVKVIRTGVKGISFQLTPGQSAKLTREDANFVVNASRGWEWNGGEAWRFLAIEDYRSDKKKEAVEVDESSVIEEKKPKGKKGK